MILTNFDSRKYLKSFIVFLLSHFVLYSLQKTDISNTLLRRFYSFWLSLADKVTTGRYNSVSLIVKTVLLESLLLTLPAPAADKTQYFEHLSFNSTFQLMAFRVIFKSLVFGISALKLVAPSLE